MNIKLNKESRSISQSKSSKIVKRSNEENYIVKNYELKKIRSVLNIDHINDKYTKSKYSNLNYSKQLIYKSEESTILINNKTKFLEYYNKFISIINLNPDVNKFLSGII